MTKTSESSNGHSKKRRRGGAAQSSTPAEPVSEQTTPDLLVPAEPSTASSTAEPGESTPPLRLRMKVWTDAATTKRYLMPTAFMRDVVKGQPVSDAMYAYAMNDQDTKLVTLTAGEWNALPFFYFREDGSAPRSSPREPDAVDLSTTSTKETP